LSKVEPMTPEGYDLLIREFKFLKEVEKPRVNHEKQVAAELGDRSENAEYHAAKEKLRHIDKRLFYLNGMIEKSRVIDPAELDHDRVHFGATVTLKRCDNDEEEQYTICGVLESEPEIGLISVHAPLARAMMGKEEGDEFSVRLPAGTRCYEVMTITYTPIFTLKKTVRSECDFSFS
jgi:transcription elongation factor GreA